MYYHVCKAAELARRAVAHTYIRHRAARHARACSSHSSGGLMLDAGICLFLRGTQPVSCATRIPFLEPFLGSHFLMTFWSQMVSPREPKIAQNHKKSCSRNLLESILQKVTKNDSIWVPSRPPNKVSYNRGIKNQEIAGPPKCHQNDLQMPPFLDAFGTIFNKKCLQEGYQKMH